MFHTVRCPICKGVLFEREGTGAQERIICRCKRMLLVESDGESVRVISEDYVAKQWPRRDTVQSESGSQSGSQSREAAGLAMAAMQTADNGRY
jgi:phage FluMu protein Com